MKPCFVEKIEEYETSNVTEMSKEIEIYLLCTEPPFNLPKAFAPQPDSS